MTPRERVDPLSLAALRFHVPLVVGVAGCLFAGWFELTRARGGGHPVAWLYAVEWPGFAVAGIIIWWRIITNRDHARTRPPGPTTRDQSTVGSDPGLIAWQQYVAEAQRRDQDRTDSQ
jgi:hypothetical protein